jgi:hypothetical protein
MQMVLAAAFLATAAPIIQSSATLPSSALANVAIDFTSVPAKIGDDNIVRLNRGVWRELVAVRNCAGQPSPLAPPMMIGDGVKIDRLSIDAGVIRVEVIEGRTAEYAGRVRFAFRVDGECVVPAAPK